MFLYDCAMRREGRESQVTAGGQPRDGLPPGHRKRFAGVPHQEMLLSARTPVELAPVTGPGPPQTHIHYPLEVGVVLSGEQKRVFEEFSFHALPGDVWLIPMWEPHGWQTLCEKTERVVIHFLPDLLGGEIIGDASWLTAFAVAPHLRPRARGPQMREQVMAIARELWAEIQEQQYAWVTAVRLGLLRLLTVLNRSWECPENNGAVPRPRLHANSLARVMPAVSAVQQEPGRRISVSEAASLCGIGRRQFHRIFSQTMGVGFQRFCLRARLAHVQRLLTATDLPIETVARDGGFVDLPHLHRHFVKQYGCTPGRYRQQRQ